ncbi:leucine-rich repeat-containing protein 3B-like [Branchiostoma floridae x Branchiostoma japonicum]
MKMKRLLVLLLIILKETAAQTCSSSDCTSTTCNCYNKGLTSVPQDLPTTTSILVLSFNDIATLNQGDFSSLRTLLFRNNQLSTLPVGLFEKLVSISSSNKRAYIAISGNPWQCDCSMLPIKQVMTGSHRFESEIICAGPANLVGKRLLNDVTPADMCEETTKAPSTARPSTPASTPVASTARTSTPASTPVASTVTTARTSTPAPCSTYWKNCVTIQFWKKASCRRHCSNCRKKCSKCTKKFRKVCPDKSTRWSTCLTELKNRCI